VGVTGSGQLGGHSPFVGEATPKLVNSIVRAQRMRIIVTAAAILAGFLGCAPFIRKPDTADACLQARADSAQTVILNRCAGYEVKVPKGCKIQRYTYEDGKDFTKCHLKPVPDGDGKNVENMIVVIAFPSDAFTVDSLNSYNEEKVTVVEKRGLQITNFVSSFVYTEPVQNYSEDLKGIITLIKGDKYNYEIHYCATVSTFQKNLPILQRVEESFRIVTNGVEKQDEL